MATTEEATKPATPTSTVTGSDSTTKAGPWVDEDNLLKEPYPLVNAQDDRPAVRDLLEEHKEKIAAMKANLEKDPLYDPVKHDALWIVRYILSHKKVDKATAAAKKFILYRKERGLDEKDIRSNVPGKDCAVDGVRKWWDCNDDDAMVFCHPDPDRGVVLFLHMKGINQDKLAEIQDDEWPFWVRSPMVFFVMTRNESVHVVLVCTCMRCCTCILLMISSV